MEIEITEHDWTYLRTINHGKIIPCPTTQPSREKLAAMNFVIVRYQDRVTITGLGREALLRRRYNLGLPVAD